MSGLTISHRQQFAFMAWRRNPERDPRYRMQTEGEAIAQAERLAQQRPGSTYIVMREVARVTFNQMPAAHPPQRSAEPGGVPPRRPVRLGRPA